MTRVTHRATQILSKCHRAHCRSGAEHAGWNYYYSPVFSSQLRSNSQKFCRKGGTGEEKQAQPMRGVRYFFFSLNKKPPPSEQTNPNLFRLTVKLSNLLITYDKMAERKLLSAALSPPTRTLPAQAIVARISNYCRLSTIYHRGSACVPAQRGT